MSANWGRQEKGEKERSKEYIKLKSKQRKLNLKWQVRSCIGPILRLAALTLLFHHMPRSLSSTAHRRKSQGNACVYHVVLSSCRLWWAGQAEVALHANKGLLRKGEDFSPVMEKAGILLPGLVWDLVQLRCLESFPSLSVGLSVFVICGALGCGAQLYCGGDGSNKVRIVTPGPCLAPCRRQWWATTGA